MHADQLSDTLAAIDIDRTILHSDDFCKLLVPVLVELLGFDSEQGDQILNGIISSSGSSLDYFSWIENEYQVHLPDAEVIAQAFLEFHTTRGLGIDDIAAEVMVRGSDELMTALSQRNFQPLLLTAGGQLLQQTKVYVIEAVMPAFEGVDYAIISSAIPKADLIAECFNVVSKRLEIARLLDIATISRVYEPKYADIKRAIVVDDKPQNTFTKQANVRGLQVNENTQSSAAEHSLFAIAATIQQM